MGNGTHGAIVYRGCGVQGYGAYGQWGCGGMGYKGYGHMGNRGTWAIGA